jgi:transposase
VNPNQLFHWRKLYQNGSLSAVSAGGEVVPASELTDALKQIKELQRLLGKKTMGNEILKEAGEVMKSRKSLARSNVATKLARPVGWQDGRSARRTDDASLVEEIR